MILSYIAQCSTVKCSVCSACVNLNQCHLYSGSIAPSQPSVLRTLGCDSAISPSYSCMITYLADQSDRDEKCSLIHHLNVLCYPFPAQYPCVLPLCSELRFTLLLAVVTLRSCSSCWTTTLILPAVTRLVATAWTWLWTMTGREHIV